MFVSGSLVSTVREKCRMCYTCVRDCPAKAIRVINGQAEVVKERCIGCGHCILVCSQKAKNFLDTTDEVRNILKDTESRKIALVAPSFPAAFPSEDARKISGALRKLGFDYVCEVGFGADLVAFRYRDIVSENRDRCYIASTCPSIVSFIEKYHADLIPLLAPVASPMIASARAMKILYGGENSRTVFIGPCIAKKEEAARYKLNGDDSIDSVITFVELKKMFKDAGIDVSSSMKREFDPPQPGLGAVFPLSGGMLQATDMRVNLLNSKILMADGHEDFVNALNEFERGAFNANLLETLCCKGCIMGAGMGVETPYFARRTAVSNYVSSRYMEMMAEENQEIYHKLLRKGLDMSSLKFNPDTEFRRPSDKEIESILVHMGKPEPEDELNCRACGYFTCRELASAVYLGLAEEEMCLPYTIERLKKSIEELNISNDKLEKTREALYNAEKLVMMGQLSAGIAHEINNPLGVILLNAGVLAESLSGKPEYHQYQEDLKLIIEQGERCRNIVSGLLNFARKNNITRENTDVRMIIDNCLKSVIKPDNVKITVKMDFHDSRAFIDSGKMIQVLVNLINNSIDAMPDGGEIALTASDAGDEITIKVRDTGIGIEKKYLNKVFEPLFTTKQAGKGTGLGLSVSYGIVKMHRGNITLVSNTNPEAGRTGTEFTITLPRNQEI